ncbi:hypothetical protein GCM10020331_048500 [Ectobacillus funiculus]
MGRYYRVEGTVVHGDKRGRQIGFPTANVTLNDDYIFASCRCVCCSFEGKRALVSSGM